MMEDVFSRDTFQSHKKYCRFGKKNFNGLYFKKLILNSPYNYKKSLWDHGAIFLHHLCHMGGTSLSFLQPHSQCHVDLKRV